MSILDFIHLKEPQPKTMNVTPEWISGSLNLQLSILTRSLLSPLLGADSDFGMLVT